MMTMADDDDRDKHSMLTIVWIHHSEVWNINECSIFQKVKLFDGILYVRWTEYISTLKRKKTPKSLNWADY